MDKADAVMTIVNDARGSRATNTSAKRLMRALKELGLDDSEKLRVLCYLDYCREDGTPYGDLKRIW